MDGRLGIPLRAAAVLLSLAACSREAENAGKAEGPVPETTDAGTSSDDATPAPWGPLPAAARRLTDARWRAAVEDLTGVAYTGALPLDYDLHGYVTVGAAGVTVSPYDLELYESAVWSVVAERLPDRSARDAWFGCAVVSGPIDGGAVDEVCVRGHTVSLLSEAWRRPPLVDEVDAMVELFITLSDEVGPTIAAQGLLAAALLSPHFTYIVEVGVTDPEHPDERLLTSWELAARLSFFLTDAPPDALLRADADTGALLDAGVLAEHARRLQATDRGRAALTRFFSETLDLARLASVDKDAALFPEDSPELRVAMVAELEALWQRIAIEEDADLRLLLTSESAWVDPSLAAVYGIPDVSAPSWVTLPPDQARGGLLGRAGLLALNATAVRTSPTFRGKFIRMRLLCEDIPPPPEGVIPSLEGLDDAGTLRDHLEQHMADPACAPCHVLMDPLGFGLENLDALGRWRSDDNGLPVNSSGNLDGVPFSDARGLGAALAEDPRYSQCLARQLQRHALGGLEGERQEADVEALADALVGGGHRLSALVAALVDSDGFRRFGSPTEETACARDGATRPCETACGEGVETCVGEIWQGCTAISAPFEACDGVDADCDGLVDGLMGSCEDGAGPGFQTCFAGSWDACAGPYTVETCDGIDNDGDGIVDGDVVESVLSVDVRTAAISDIVVSHGDCDPTGDITTGPCGAAHHRLCAAAGCSLETGFGPVAIDESEGTASYVCLGDDAVELVWSTFAELASYHGGCSISDPMSPNCNASISRLCSAKGLGTGFGPLEHGADIVLVGCTPTASVFQVSYADLTALDAGCAWPSDVFNGACRGAMHHWCEAQGFATGHGPLENWNGDAWIACIPRAEVP